MEEEGKIFVGGLSWTTTEKSLHEYFTNFGGVAKVQIMRDGVTNRPRGFAFVTFDDPSAVFRVLDHKDRHILDHKQIDPKPALLQGKGGGLSANRMANRPLPPLGLGASANAYDSFLHNPVAPSSPIYTGRTKKLFIGGIAKGTDEDDVRTYFATYGLVKDVVFMSEKDTKRPRGFGFVTMDSEESVDDIVREKFHQINGKRVEAKKAVPRPGEHEYYQQSGVSPRAQYSGFGFPTSATAPYGTSSSGGFGQSFSQGGSQMNYAGQQQQSQNAVAGTSPAAYGFTGSAYASQAPGGPAPAAFNSVGSNYQANSFSTSGMGRDGVFGSPPSALGSTLGAAASAGFGSSVVESGLSSSFDPFSGSGSNQVGASFSQFGSYGQEIQSAGTGFSQFGSTLGSQDIHQSSFVGGSSLLGSGGGGGGPSSLPGDDSDGGFPTSALASLTTQANSMMENSLNGQQQSQQASQQQQQRISEQQQPQQYYNEFGVASGNVSSSSFGGGPAAAAAPARGTGGSLSSNSLFGEF